MKNNKNIFLAVIILAIIAFLIYLFKTNGTIKKELRDFAIEDTSLVTKIFLVDKQNQQVLLERNENKWLLNNKYPARPDLVNLLLKTINRIEVKAPVSNAAVENVIKSLAAKSTKVEIYQNNELLKTYYVGGPTQDQYGTFMLLENSSRPFIMNIPGFRGYLTTRYITDPFAWRSQVIFQHPTSSIKSVVLNNFEKPNSSFIIQDNGDNRFELFSLKDNLPINNFDTIKVKRYLAHFQFINVDKFLENTDEVYVKDSLINSTPYFELTLEDNTNDKISISGYRRPNYDKVLDDEGNLYTFDVDFLYGLINNKSELVLIQYYVFDPLIADVHDFTNH